MWAGGEVQPGAVCVVGPGPRRSAAGELQVPRNYSSSLRSLNFRRGREWQELELERKVGPASQHSIAWKELSSFTRR